jgi:uncharacterized protein (DUF39 family)
MPTFDVVKEASAARGKDEDPKIRMKPIWMKTIQFANGDCTKEQQDSMQQCFQQHSTSMQTGSSWPTPKEK